MSAIRLSLFCATLLLLAPSLPVAAQQAGVPPAASPAPVNPAPAAAPTAPKKRGPAQPGKEAAPGGGPDKVWVNLNSSTYHCYGDRYYGKTANGRYMTEAAAKSAGAHGAGNKSCAASK